MDRRLLFAGAAVAVAAGAALMRAHASPSPSAFIAGPVERPAHIATVPAARATEPAERLSLLHVYVAGEVAHPGVYRLRASARADDALGASGGATAKADLVAVNLAAPLRDGEELVVPARGAAGTAINAASDGATPDDAAAGAALGRDAASLPHPKRHRKRRRRRHAVAAPGAGDAAPGASEASATNRVAPVDVNSAGAEELAALPGIGPALAQRIVTFREVNGRFASLDELLDVNGMTPARLDAISADVVVR